MPVFGFRNLLQLASARNSPSRRNKRVNIDMRATQCTGPNPVGTPSLLTKPRKAAKRRPGTMEPDVWRNR